MKRRQLLPLAACLLLSRPAHAAQDARRLVMATMFEHQDSGVGLLLATIYQEAFRRLSVELEIRVFPPARARMEAIAGNVDGELARSYGYEATQQAMLRVPEATLVATTCAYVHNPQIRLNGWDSLRGTGYRVEYRAGYAVIGDKLASLVAPEQLSRVGTGEQGLRKLAVGRTDVYVDNEEFVEPILASGVLGPLGIYKAGVLERTPIYAYLNKRHASLALRLAEVLRKMKADGDIDRIRSQVRAHAS